MKYQVKIQYTNPSHEHVSLRRRVESVTRLVEAANEQEAINRAANQQRALGFIIKEAAVYAPVTGLHSLALNNNEPQKGKEKKKKLVGNDGEKTDIAAAGGVKEAAGGTESYPLLKKGEKLKPMKIGEGFDPEPKDIAAHLVSKHGKGKVTKDHVDAYERDRDSNKGIDKEAVMKHVQKMSEDVESVDEAKKPLKPSYWKAEWRLGTQSEVDKNNKKIYDKLAKTDPEKAAKFHDSLMKLRKEEIEQIDEVGDTAKGRAALGSYVKKKHDQFYHNRMMAKTQGNLDKLRKDANKNLARAEKRLDPKGPFANSKFIKSEEVESVEESVATAQKVMDRAKVVANTNPDPKKRFAASGLAQKAMLRTINPTGVNTGITRGGGNKTYRMVTGKVPPYQLTKKTGVSEEVVTEASKEGKDVMRNMRAGLKSMDLRHGVDSDKRDAGYKMSPAVRKAQAASDALSKREKKPQAGTLAAKKARNAAEKMVNKAKGNANKIDVEPSIEPGKPNA